MCLNCNAQTSIAHLYCDCTICIAIDYVDARMLRASRESFYPILETSRDRCSKNQDNSMVSQPTLYATLNLPPSFPSFINVIVLIVRGNNGRLREKSNLISEGQPGYYRNQMEAVCIIGRITKRKLAR